jgi:Bardet-Biedl syndrome 9 protein
MSLFQNKEWWAVKVGEAEEFDSHHLCIGSILPSLPDDFQIIVGSLQGKLRIYSPHYAPFKMEDLLFEKDFQNPIIQIVSGRFSFANPNPVICVLFFKKISVLQFFMSKSNGGGLIHKVCYEANLPRNAYNMVYGHFGRGDDKELICVQSCDGALMIYEQDNLISLAQMNDFVLPSPMIWIEPINCFILQNSAYELECFR